MPIKVNIRRYVLLILTLMIAVCLLPTRNAIAQFYGTRDRGNPGDTMIQEYLEKQAQRLHDEFDTDVISLANWEIRRPQYLQELLYMLGLDPLPPRTDLKTTVTGTLHNDEYVVEKLHYQSSPGLYVTANLYRPSHLPPGKQLPAVIYVCGHHPQGRDGVKAHYQSHGIWFAKHGYICLTLDTLQLGEIESIHHGTYREARWWWLSRGYTPAGVECWNGIRGIDYLLSRPDVDPKRIGVTGISGGGAVSFWLAAVDDRVAAAVPVSGMADLPSYVGNQVLKGQCDCIFMHNTYRWPWSRIAGMVAPRHLLFVNSHQDDLFPMDANERIINRLERVYALYGAGDRVDSLVSLGGHDYRSDIRRAEYRFFNTYFHQNPEYVVDSEFDLVTKQNGKDVFPIDPVQLRVFPTDADLPSDAKNVTIDRHFVSIAHVQLPTGEDFAKWKQALWEQVCAVSFRVLPKVLPTAHLLSAAASNPMDLETEPGIRVRIHLVQGDVADAPAARVFLVVLNETQGLPAEVVVCPAWLKSFLNENDIVYICEPRGTDATRWTQRNPPNYVERAHALIGQTVDTGRVRDVAATAAYLQRSFLSFSDNKGELIVAGEGSAAILAAYAAFFAHDIDSVLLMNPVLTHMEPHAPQFLNVLRVCDIPEVLGMLAPRPLTIISRTSPSLDRVQKIYRAAHASHDLSISLLTSTAHPGPAQ